MNNLNEYELFEGREKFFRKKEDQALKLIPKNKYYIIRIDGKGFSKLTKKYFEKPYDVFFETVMQEMTKYILEKSGLKILFGYVQSDEVSFVVNYSDDSYSRKERKILSIIPSLASSFFTQKTGHICSFDSRIILMDNIDEIKEYINWRIQDCERNCINNYAYSIVDNPKKLEGLSTPKKLALFKEKDFDYSTINKHEKYGSIIYFLEYQKKAYNKLSGKEVIVSRKKAHSKSADEMLDEIENIIQKEIK